MVEMLVLFVTGFAAGILNAIAGGGTFFDLSCVGMVRYSAGNGQHHINFCRHARLRRRRVGLSFRPQSRRHLNPARHYRLSTIGAIIGSLLLIVTPSDVFVGVVLGCCCWQLRCLVPAPRSCALPKTGGLGRPGSLFQGRLLSQWRSMAAISMAAWGS